MVEGLALGGPIAVALLEVGEDDVGAGGLCWFISSVERGQRCEQQGGENDQGVFQSL